MDLLIDPEFALNFPDRIEQLRIHGGGVIGAPVAQEVVELLEAVVVVAAIALEGDGDVVAAMGVVQRDGAGVAIGDGGVQAVGAGNRNDGG